MSVYFGADKSNYNEKPWYFGEDEASRFWNGLKIACIHLAWEDGDGQLIDIERDQFELICDVLGIRAGGTDTTINEDGTLERRRKLLSYTPEQLSRIRYMLEKTKAISKATHMTEDEEREMLFEGADWDDLI